MNSANSSVRSDREKAGLRGPVRSVVHERTYAPVTSADGSISPELSTWMKTVYDRKGRTSAVWGRNSSRYHGLGNDLYVTLYAYTDAGQLQRKTLETNGDRQSEISYRYDDRCRLQSITNSKDPDNPIAFHYDANGLKAKITVAKPSDNPEGGNGSAVSYSPSYLFGTETGAVGLPGGSTSITLYDDLDRPVEVQTRNAAGEVVYRTLREYDAQGNVLAEKQTMDDVLRIIPAAQQKQILADGDVSAKELRDQITQMLGDGSEMGSTRFTYDEQDREVLRIDKSLGRIDQRVQTSYNEHGDVAKETWQVTTTGMPDAESNGTSTSERVYTYEYDIYGNWIVKKTSSRTLPDSNLKDTGDIERRTIDYY